MAIELTYKKLGDETLSPPLVILHGLLGSAGNWRTIARQLQETRTIYCLNLRNHGESPHVPTMSYPEMAEDVEAFIASLAVNPVDLLGHSMGGKVAMSVALRRPDLLRKLLVVDTAPVRYSNLSFDMFDAICSVNLDSIKSRDDADRQMREHLSNATLRSFVLTNLRRAKDMRFQWRVNVKAIRDELTTIIDFPDFSDRTFSGETLFLGGALSGYLKDYATEIQARFTDATTELIPNAGHWPHADEPTATVACLKRFLDGGAA